MNRAVLAAVAAALAIFLPTQALACTPVPAKTWSGSVQFANHVSLSKQSWDNNGCSFHHASLTNFDSIAFNMTSHRGLAATAKWSTAQPVRPTSVNGVFYTAGCVPIAKAGFFQSDPGKTVGFSVPTNAKWLLVTPATITPGKDIAVTVHSPGRKCPT